MSPQTAPPKVREYRLDLTVDPATSTYGGRLVAELEEPASTVALNAVGLEVEPVRATDRVDAHPESEEVWVVKPSATPTVEVRFRGKVPDRALVGLYRSKYGDGSILTTQCEAVSARRLFPCLDRPDRKAVVRLTLTVPPGVEAIFNTRPIRSTDRDGHRVIEFAPTPRMSTYLVYLGIGRFEWLHGPNGRTRISVAAPPGRSSAGQFALDRAGEILPAFERYFGLPFPLDKLDLVAVPEFAYGAMENWGAISFREMRLLVDATTSVLQRRETLVTIAHEIAHQWFGNLVTMAWWTDLWLNESFATFMETKIVESLYPQERAVDDLLIGWTAPAMAGDSLAVTHPVRVPVERPEEIDQIFDEISYGKGSAVLRMVDGFLGAERFQSGVNRYLKTHAEGNATSDDLWTALERSADRPLRPLLSAWIERPGLPLLTAALTDGTVRITQRRFSLSGGHPDEHWPVPVVATIDGAERKFLFDQPAMELPIGSDRPVHLNAGALGFYRVLYDPALYERLRSGFSSLPAVDRWSIVQDLFAFVLSGDLPRERYYEFLDASQAAPEYLLVLEIANQLSSTGTGRQPSPLGALLGEDPLFRRHATSWLTAQIERLGLAAGTDEPGETAVVRGRVASSLVALDPAFSRSMVTLSQGGERLPPDLQWPVALARALTGGATEFDRIADEIRAAPSEGDALRLERALGRFPDAALVEKALSLGRTPLVNRAHLPSLVREAALNPVGRTAVWAWIRTVLHESEPDYRGTGAVGTILEGALPFAGLGRRDEVEREITERPFHDGDRGARKGLALLSIYERLLAGRR